MAHPSQTFINEAVSAAQGCWALIIGRRDAAAYFDFSQRGLVGSLLAVVLALLVAGFGPMLFGLPVRPGSATESVVINGVLFVTQAAMAWLVLRQMGRQDGFVPYMVASNWVTLLSGLLLLVSLLFGQLGLVVLLAIVIVAIMTFINIGRLIVTLKPMQILLLFISQAVGVFLALGLMVLVLPPSALQ